ncbi:TPA: hypothetical protein N2N40_002522 [Citrobacter freundii]|nr:hypothetical protein [Citrobacter freundii]
MQYKKGYLTRQQKSYEQSSKIIKTICIIGIIFNAMLGYLALEFTDSDVYAFMTCVLQFLWIGSLIGFAGWISPVSSEELVKYIHHSSPESAGLFYINKIVVSDVPVRGKHIYFARKARKQQRKIDSSVKTKKTRMGLSVSENEIFNRLKNSSNDD